MQVDLHAILHDRKTPELLPLRRWARKKREGEAGVSGIVRVPWAVILEMANMFDFERDYFVERLLKFTPVPTVCTPITL